MRVLMVSSEWPSAEHPHLVPFLVREVEHLRASNISIDVLPFRGGMRPQNYAKAWRDLRIKLREGQYDLLHAQFGQSGLLSLPSKPLPLVVTFRGSDLNGIVNQHGRQTLAGWLLRKVSQLVALYADSVILVSTDLARHLPRSDYSVIPSGLDMDLFKPIPRAEARRTLGLDMNRRYVLFAGARSNPIKRYDLAQEAVSLCNNKALDLLVAEGVHPDKMPLYMNAADVLLLTSSCEGSPNVVKEALACNLPVVAVDVGDVRQRLYHVSGCMVCDDDHPAVIAAGLESVLQGEKRIAGRETVLNLDVQLTTKRIIDVYRQTLSMT